MSYSLNEVEATAKKAARGGGYGWGHAEEAGKAARWLCSFGFDGCKALASVLRTFDGCNLRTRYPVSGSGEWRASSDVMCPLYAGTLVSDTADKLNEGPLTLRSVAEPLLLLPFAYAAARLIHKAVAVEWQGVSAVCSSSGLNWTADNSAQLFGVVERVGVSISNAEGITGPSCSRASPMEETWSSLLAFAHRTYAPATEESRLLGAGAGTSDND